MCALAKANSLCVPPPAGKTLEVKLNTRKSNYYHDSRVVHVCAGDVDGKQSQIIVQIQQRDREER